MAAKKKDSKGIVLIATGHVYYGRYAYQLATSIRFTDPEIGITLLTDGTATGQLNNLQRSIFDEVKVIDNKYLTRKGQPSYIKPKVYLNELTPYDRTIYLDVDMIHPPKRQFAELFDMLEGTEWAVQNWGAIDLAKTTEGRHIPWIDTEDIVSAYKLKEGKLYNYCSEFIYFEKTANTKKYFSAVQKVYETPGVRFLDFSGTVPDELAFSIASAKLKFYPKFDNWRPIYWEHKEKQRIDGADLNNSYWGYSLGGAITSNWSKKVYNNLLNFYVNKTGLTMPLQARDKRSFLTNRAVI